MATPTVAEQPDESGPTMDGGGEEEDADDVADEALDDAEEMAREATGESEAADPEDEPNVEEAELSDDDLSGAASDLFTDTDDASSESSESDDSDDSGGESESNSAGDGDALDALSERGEGMESAINDGAARLAVVGMDDDEEKEELETEFCEVFEAFRLGYFGSRVAEEYIFTDDDEEVDPAWGLLGACLTCAALVVWMRPDGEEMVSKARDAVENIAGGAA